MNKVFVPMRLRILTSFLWLMVPMICIQSILISGKPYWEQSYQRLGIIAVLALCVFVPLAHWLRVGYSWAFNLACVLSGLWIFISALNSLVLGYFWLHFFVLVLLLSWFLFLGSVYRETGRSYMSAHTQWFHGLPEPIMGLTCEIMTLQGEVKRFKVANIDMDGILIFDKNPVEFSQLFGKKRKISLTLYYRGRSITQEVVLMRQIQEGKCLGFKFITKRDDHSVRLCDFVLRAGGMEYEI